MAESGLAGEDARDRVEEVLARIEAGAGRDANDLLDLRERCLDLFRVTSKGGVACASACSASSTSRS